MSDKLSYFMSQISVYFANYLLLILGYRAERLKLFVNNFKAV